MNEKISRRTARFRHHSLGDIISIHYASVYLDNNVPIDDFSFSLLKDVGETISEETYTCHPGTPRNPSSEIRLRGVRP
jgi:hypothetical protein